MNCLSIVILIILFFNDSTDFCNPKEGCSRCDATFKVSDLSKKPIKNAGISLTNLLTHMKKILYTNSKGYCHCSLLNNCEYIVVVTKETYYKTIFSITPRDNCKYHIHLTRMFHNRLYGYIRDCKQNPIDRAIVVLYKVTSDNKLIPKKFTYTDSTGEYNFFNISEGLYIIKSVK